MGNTLKKKSIENFISNYMKLTLSKYEHLFLLSWIPEIYRVLQINKEYINT